MAILTVENLTHTYGAHSPFEKHAVRDVSLEIQEGELLGIIGHTGSGKSTLIQHLNGLLRPHGGRVLLDGTDIWEKPKKIRDVRFRVGMVFQYPEHQLFEDTIYKDIAFGPKNMGLSEEEIDRRVRQAAAYVGLSEALLDKSPFDLSGGEKRRAAIAGVMAMEPQVIILDEPTASLDPMAEQEIFNQFDKLSADKTTVFVSHRLSSATAANKIIVLEYGKIIEMGDHKTLMAAHGKYFELFSTQAKRYISSEDEAIREDNFNNQSDRFRNNHIGPRPHGRPPHGRPPRIES